MDVTLQPSAPIYTYTPGKDILSTNLPVFTAPQIGRQVSILCYYDAPSQGLTWQSASGTTRWYRIDRGGPQLPGVPAVRVVPASAVQPVGAGVTLTAVRPCTSGAVAPPPAPPTVTPTPTTTPTTTPTVSPTVTPTATPTPKEPPKDDTGSDPAPNPLIDLVLPPAASRSPQQYYCPDAKPSAAKDNGSGGGWILNETESIPHYNLGHPAVPQIPDGADVSLPARDPDPPGERAKRATACLVKPTDPGSAAHEDPAGWEDARYREARLRTGTPAPTPPFPIKSRAIAACHLIAGGKSAGTSLGGEGIARNLVPCWQVPTNTGRRSMATYEGTVRTALDRATIPGQAVIYQVTPEYRDGGNPLVRTSTIPERIRMVAYLLYPPGSGLAPRQLVDTTIDNSKQVNGRWENLGN
ncbi:MAG TPA: hypothetical protein VF069_05640 [Streptosporangiaceae bacterium]